MYEKYLEQLLIASKMRNLSTGTTRTYIHSLTTFFDEIKKEPSEIMFEDIQGFLLAKREKGVSAATCNGYHSAIRFFFRYVLHKPWNEDIVPRMIREQPLPKVMLAEDIELLLSFATNIKYKAIISLLYGSGLRVSEVVNLDYCDISRSTMQVHVRNTKNRSERYTILSQRSLDILTEYWFKCGKPTGALFINQATKKRLTASAVEQYIRKISRKAKIPYAVSPHTLRHSFATHLLEAGTDVRYIQALLEHRTPVSTNKYLHVTNKAVMGVKSPFDFKAGEIHG